MFPQFWSSLSEVRYVDDKRKLHTFSKPEALPILNPLAGRASASMSAAAPITREANGYSAAAPSARTSAASREVNISVYDLEKELPFQLARLQEACIARPSKVPDLITAITTSVHSLAALARENAHDSVAPFWELEWKRAQDAKDAKDGTFSNFRFGTRQSS